MTSPPTPPPWAVPIDVAAAMESYLTLAFATTDRVKIEAGDHVVVLALAAPEQVGSQGRVSSPEAGLPGDRAQSHALH